MIVELEDARYKLTCMRTNIKELGNAISIDELRKTAEELDAQTLDPDFWNNQETSGKILKEVKSVIDGLREDPKAVKNLEMMLDRNNNGLVARLREQLPKMKAEDIKLFIFAASGFSSTTISTILEKDKGIVYNRIWRLKGKISSSEAPDKEEFLDSIKS